MKTPFAGGSGGGAERIEDSEKDLAMKEGWAYQKLRTDVKALEEFERSLKLQGKIKEVYVPHALQNQPGGKKSSAIQEAFPDAEVKYLEEKTTDVEKHERYGHVAIRGHAETHRGEKVDLVALFDTKVDATWQLMQNVEKHGYFICRARHAPEVLRSGKFEVKGVIKMHGSNPTFEKDEAKFSRIEKDKDFENAERTPGAVTMEEMRDTVRKAFPGTSEGFVEKYKDLIKQAKEQNGELTAAHSSSLKWKGEVDGKKIELDINTILPTKKDDETLWVFRKWNL